MVICKRLSGLGALLGLLVASATANAADARADFLTKLFATACVPNMGKPDGVRSWAIAHNLRDISDPLWLKVFVGPGDKGAAWAIPTDIGKFALSIRGITQGCSTWAIAADPAVVEGQFRTLFEGVKRPGLTVRLEKDTTTQSLRGKVRTIAYIVSAPTAHFSHVFFMMSAEKEGGPFQAWLNLTLAGADEAAPPALTAP